MATWRTHKGLLCKKVTAHELKVMKLVCGRRNILEIERVENAGNGNYYVHMEYCSGGNLQEYFERNIRMISKVKAEGVIKPMISECLYAIQSCHDVNVVHSDIKLENFVLDKDSNIRLIDFGASHILETRESVVPCTQSTAEYTAPEALRSELGLRSDIWAIGIMIYYMLQKKFPFIGETRYDVWKSVLNDPASFSKSEWKDAGISPECMDFVSLALLKDYKTRMWVEDCLKHPFLNNK